MRPLAILTICLASMACAAWLAAADHGPGYCGSPLRVGPTRPPTVDAVQVDTLVFQGRQTLSSADTEIVRTMRLTSATACAIRLFSEVAGLNSAELRRSRGLCLVLNVAGRACVDDPIRQASATDRIHEYVVYVTKDKSTGRALGGTAVIRAYGGKVNTAGEKPFMTFEVRLELGELSDNWYITSFRAYTPQ